MKTVYVDIDLTICSGPIEVNGVNLYNLATPYEKNIAKINKHYDEGHKIVYWSARGSVSGLDWRELTEQQLKTWGAKYHELSFDKPSFDVLYDDKAFNLDDL